MATRKNKPTTDRREVFCRAYAVAPNATRAAIKAGYSPKTARSQGSFLLANQNVKDRIAVLQGRAAEKYEVSAERVLAELAKMAYANLDDYMDVTPDGRVLNTVKPTRDQMAAVAEIIEDATGGRGDGERKMVTRTKFKLADKGLALERLGRHLKLFTDRVDVTGLEGLADKIAQFRAKKTESPQS